ncbi:hypothetical protein PNA2_1194 [Pyrococcus sp. NA2]|uniref:hypothetical protein n=1 Tax=Pyrococcus sp. (strain NA2) TaxID=342949 RepID=UPI000209ABE9|nr:hypothetical protein [Pyrococcus sp. NA2]AEC52109.1 hypothetical protein PNA2_1194 [Pyrococcus sp. NA2]
MRDFKDDLRFLEEFIWILVEMAMVSPLWLYYLLVKGVHTYLLQTLGISDDPLGFIKLLSVLLAGLGMIIPLYGVAEALVDIFGARERYLTSSSP